MDYTSGALWISLFADFMLDMLECHTFGQEMVKSVREKRIFIAFFSYQ